MGRVQGGVRRTTESRERGEEMREEKMFDISVSEVVLLFCPGGGGRFSNDAAGVCFLKSAGFVF